MKKLLLFFIVAGIAPAKVIWDPLPAGAYQLKKSYPEAQSLLYAFDYGHALIYDRLLQAKLDGEKVNPNLVDAELLLRVRQLLDKETLTKVEEEDVAPEYARKFDLTLSLFDLSHYLHQFTYDMFLLPNTDRRIAALYAAYRDRDSIALSEACLSMKFMNSQRTPDGQSFSKAFRETYPSLNDIIWVYHWYQIALYKALMQPEGPGRDKAVAEVIAEFRKKVKKVPENFEDMPLVEEVTPQFAKRFPRITNVFDNLHMLHDVISDLLASPKVPAKALLKEARRFSIMAMDPPAEYRSDRCVSERESK